MSNFDQTQLDVMINQMIQNAMNPTPALNEIGGLMVSEMKLNIDSGGRPDPWEAGPSIRAQKNGGQTLRDTGNLYNSINFEVEDNKTVTAGPGGTAEKYAAVQNFGATITAKNVPYLKFFIPGVGWIQKNEVTILPRPFDYLSPEAQNTFGDILQRFLNAA